VTAFKGLDGAPIGQANFRNDVNATGTIMNADVTAAKDAAGLHIQVPQKFGASDATIIRSRFDSNSMRPSNLHYKIVILFPSSALKLSSLITGEISPFSIIL
jgi:hypothetical protein